ncbi:hypothetical protein ACLOJK_036033 [Asimina triloba]
MALSSAGLTRNGEPKVLSYAHAVAKPADNPAFVMPMRFSVDINGELGFIFSEPEMAKAAEDYKFAIVLKFMRARPSIDNIRLNVVKMWGLLEVPTISFMDDYHVCCDEDLEVVPETAQTWTYVEKSPLSSRTPVLGKQIGELASGSYSDQEEGEITGLKGKGPLYFEYALYNGTLPSLKSREYPWTKISSVIFVDSPVGTGFSFSSGSKDYVLDDIKAAKQAYQFLIKVGGPWLIAHLEFQSNPLYIAGDSYCGLILPVVVNEIANGIEAGKGPIVNLKGYSLGNPLTDRLIDGSSFVPYAHGMGLIPDELYEVMSFLPSTNLTNPLSGRLYVGCVGQEKLWRKLVSADLWEVQNIAGLEKGQILEPKCPRASPKPFTVGPGRLLDENSRALRLPDILPGLGCRNSR